MTTFSNPKGSKKQSIAGSVLFGGIMHSSTIGYIQKLEKHLGLKISLETEILKMTPEALSGYVSYLEDTYKQKHGQYLN